MTNNLVSMQQIQVLIQHLKTGVSNRRIGFELSNRRNTIVD